MRRLLLPLLLGYSISAFAAEKSFKIDSAHTYPNCTINHMGFSTMHGRFGKTTGKITMDRDNNKGNVEVTIDAASVDTGFKKRDDHLRSQDFLNAVEFPEITYKSSKVSFNDQGGATFDGQLTIMGENKPVTLNVDSINCGIHPMDPKKTKYVCGFNATGNIMRSDFGVKYALPAIGDEMNLVFEVEAIRN